MSKEFYKVLFSQEYAKKKCGYGIVEAFPEPYDEYLLSDNEAFPFAMLEDTIFKVRGGVLADWQMALYPWRLVSEQFKCLLEKFNGSEDVYFHPVTLYDAEDDSKAAQYYLLHFKRTLGYEQADHNKPEVIAQKNEFHFQAFNDDITGTFFVSETLKNEIQKNNFTGITFAAL